MYIIPIRRNPIYWFGMIGGSLGPYMHAKEAKKLIVPRCNVRGCPFPRTEASMCHRHANFFEYSFHMRGGRVEKADVYKERDSSTFPTLDVMHGWEIKNSFEQAKFVHRNQWDKDRRGSDAWWAANVSAVLSEPRPTNLQGSPIVPAWKGYGKKKIRKMMRMRGPGYHGKRPDSKPLDSFDRESIRYEFLGAVNEVHASSAQPRELQGGGGVMDMNSGSMPEPPLSVAPQVDPQETRTEHRLSWGY